MSKYTTTTTKNNEIKRKKFELDSDSDECDSCNEKEDTKVPSKKLQTKKNNNNTIDLKQSTITQFFKSTSNDNDKDRIKTTTRKGKKKEREINNDHIKVKSKPGEDIDFVNKFNSKKSVKLENVKIGAHMSIQGGFPSLIAEACKRGFSALAFFTSSPRQWAHKQVSDVDASEFKEQCKKYSFPTHCIMPHGSYFLNLGSPSEEGLKKSRDLLVKELKTCEKLNIPLYNFHPGSHLGLISEGESIKLIAESINLAIKETKNVILVIECTAGQGSNIGYKFEHLRDIISLVDDKSRVGVCLDTCHMFAGGYDLKTKTSCTHVFKQFDEVVGFSYLKGLHLNDSKEPLNSRKDRHENIDKGEIGSNCFKFLVNDSRFQNIPMILETAGNHIDEVKQLYNYIEDDPKDDKKQEE